jgi:mannitol/fructose-specific phosphotransferase system IIA component (Ntr-type)
MTPYDASRRSAEMKVIDFVVKDAIICDLKAKDKSTAIREMVDSLADSGGIRRDEVDGVVSVVLRREQLASTGIGFGVGVPHSKHVSVDKIVSTVAISKTGVEFDSIDREPVFVIFILISPPALPGNHLRALESIASHLKKPDFSKKLRAAANKDEVFAIIKAADAEKESEPG